MDEPNTTEGSIGLSTLVRAALEGDARGGITNLLKKIASITNSFGCVLWRATQDAKPPDIGEITMLAGWFDAENSFFGINRISFKDTVTGRAAMDGFALDNDLEQNQNPYCKTPFFARHHVNKAAACRFTFLSGRLGVLMIYRQGRRKDSDLPAAPPTFKDVPFEAQPDIDQLREISKVLPYLYSGARQKASYGLLKEVGAILRKAREAAKPSGTTAPGERKKVLRSVAKALTDTFHSIETSVFLEDSRHPGTFTCAFTSKGPHSKMVRKNTYQPTLEGGFSAFCLYSRKPIRVHDMQDSQAERDAWRKEYPGFRGHQTTGLSKIVNEFLGNPSPPPPHSSMTVPLVSDGELLGFIRCWVARSGPSYFSSDDLELLQLVADFLSQTVVAWKQEGRVLESRKRDHEAFKNFAQTGRAVGKKGDERDIFLAALDVVQQVIPEASFNTIQLRRSDPDRLDSYGYSISPQYGVPADELEKRLLKLSLPLPAKSLAGTVVQNDTLRLFRGTQLTKHPTDVAAEAGEMIIAPITVNKRVEGVLELRTKKKEKFPPQAQAVAGSISTLLALQMAKEKAEDERLRLQRQQLATEVEAARQRGESDRAMREAFEDVSHQLKSPLGEAGRRVEECQPRHQHGQIAQDLEAVATLLRRAELTAKLIGVFANLAKGQQLTITGSPMTTVELVRMIGQVCENQRPRISPRRNIRIVFDAESIYKHSSATFSADSELLLQALNNLVDNAVKYSYPNTVIRVFGAALKRGGFMIAVTNKGIPIKPSEVHLVRKRNWRGELAKASSGEGNGLGLWIVDHVMRAHGGELQVLPTRPTDGITELRLAFPFAT